MCGIASYPKGGETKANTIKIYSIIATERRNVVSASSGQKKADDVAD